MAGSCSRGGGMDPRMREDNGGGMGGVCTPILTFPPEGGREGRDGMGSCIREDTGGGAVDTLLEAGIYSFCQLSPSRRPGIGSRVGGKQPMIPHPGAPVLPYI